MSEMEKEMENLTTSLKPLCEKMKETFHLPPYHYIELFILFIYLYILCIIKQKSIQFIIKN